MRPAGLLALAAGALFVVIGLRGSQHAVFPGLFPGGPSSTTDNASNLPVAPGTPHAQPLPTIPGVTVPTLPQVPGFPFLSASGVTA